MSIYVCQAKPLQPALPDGPLTHSAVHIALARDTYVINAYPPCGLKGVDEIDAD